MQANRYFRIMSTLMTSVVAAALIASCSSGPKIYVNEDPNGSFDQYKTYNYEGTLGTDEQKGYRSVFSNYLINAMDREMQSRGYVLAADPDLIVNFYVNTQEKIRTTQSPSMGGYYGYRGGAYGAYGGYDTTVTQYTEGTVNIDLVDNRKDVLAWEGVIVGRITDKVRENLEEASNAVVAEAMEKYPYVAAGYVPPPPPAEDQ